MDIGDGGSVGVIARGLCTMRSGDCENIPICESSTSDALLMKAGSWLESASSPFASCSLSLPSDSSSESTGVVQGAYTSGSASSVSSRIPTASAAVAQGIVREEYARRRTRLTLELVEVLNPAGRVPRVPRELSTLRCSVLAQLLHVKPEFSQRRDSIASGKAKAACVFGVLCAC